MKGERIGEFEELVLLAVCTLQPDAYGAALKELIEAEAGRSVSVGAIYAALDRLERKQCVSSHVGGATEERGGRRKRLYQATNTGIEVLQDVRAVRERFWRGLDLGLQGT